MNYGKKCLLIVVSIIIFFPLFLHGEESGRFGGTLRVAVTNDAVSLDPPNQWDGSSSRVINNIYENLVKYDLDSMRIIPSLATTWEVSLDKKSWIFTIRKNVFFHDGTLLTPEDIKFNFDRQLIKNHKYALGNCDCFKTNFAILKSVEVVKNRVKFNLKKPYVPFVEELAMSPLGIASPRAIKKWKDRFYLNPVGTGPFIFSKWDRGKKIILKRYDKYWGRSSYLDTVIFEVIKNNKLKRVKLINGSIDIMDNIAPEDIDILKRNSKIKVYSAPGLNVGYIAMNTRKKPYDDVRVRKAVNYAINREAIINYIYQGSGIIAKTPIPPNMWGFNDKIIPYKYNPEKARELLKEAGYADGFSTSLYILPISTDTIPFPDKIGSVIVSNLKEIGIDVKKISFDWKEYQEKIKNGEHDMAMLSWTADIPDPDNFLYVMFSTDNSKIGIAENISFFSNRELDDILIKAQETFDENERAELYKKAQVIINNNAPWINLAHTKITFAYNKNIKNFKITPIVYENYKDVWKNRGKK